MRKILLLMLLCFLTVAKGHAQYIDVTDIYVDYEGQLGYKVLETFSSFEDVRRLRITGPINDEDWKSLKEMRNLEELYMTDAIAYSMPPEQFNSFYNLRIAEMPVTLQRIEYFSFYNCSNLTTIDLPSVDYIGDNAFWSCYNLQNVNVPYVTYINSSAFGYCNNLHSIELPNVSYIGPWAFQNCSSLNSIALPNIETLEYGAFLECSNLSSVSLSDKLTSFGTDCFKNCYELTSLVLPASIISIPDGVFDNCNKIRDIECNAPIPPSVGMYPFANEVIYTATLRVQGASLNAYRWDYFWGRFGHWEESPTRVTDLILNNHLTINEDMRLDKLHLTINPGAALTINGNTLQEFKSVSIVSDDSGCGVLLSNSNAVVSDATRIVYEMKAGKWYYVTLPFSVNLSHVDMTELTQVALYDYDGATRAANSTGSSWRRISEGALQAGRGYIIQALSDTKLIFNADHNVLNDAFTPYAITTPVSEYPSPLGASEAGWNFVGNPYPTYFDIRYMDFSAPITVWTGSTYAAYSVADDELALQPLQPFFVQCPTGTDHITFNTAGRQTTSDIDHSRTMTVRRSEGAVRRLANIVLKAADGSEHDRTRLVVNAAATDGYDMDCDAAKMMSTDETVAQIWTHRDGTRYAINEGPQTGGRVAMGVYLPTAGTYTIEAPRADMSLKLYDSTTGTETLLGTDGAAYTFVTAEAGTMADRFYLLTDGGTTGISTGTNRDGNAADATFHTIDGRYAGNSADALAPGVYVKKDETGKTTKVIIR